MLGAGEAAILEAIQSGCVTATEIDNCLKAGTNRGSCVPELKALPAQRVVKKNRLERYVVFVVFF